MGLASIGIDPATDVGSARSRDVAMEDAYAAVVGAGGNAEMVDAEESHRTDVGTAIRSWCRTGKVIIYLTSSVSHIVARPVVGGRRTLSRTWTCTGNCHRHSRRYVTKGQRLCPVRAFAAVDLRGKGAAVRRGRLQQPDESRACVSRRERGCAYQLRGRMG